MADATLSDIALLLREQNKKLDALNPNSRLSNLKGLGKATVTAAATGAGAAAGAGKGIGSALKGAGGGLGGLLGGMGKGIGFAGAGIGAALLGLSQVMEKITFDPEDIKKDVNTLLSIGEDRGGQVEFLKEGGQFGLAMAGLGAGLLAFGAGQALTAGAQWLSEDKWAETVKSNVKTLLEISSLPGADNLGVDIAIPLGMIGGGLVAFGIGQATVGFAESLTKFSGAEDWAKNVRDNIETLLEIPALENATFTNVTAFPAVMAMISAGLIAFSVGSIAKDIASVPETAANALKKFAGEEGDALWATSIRDNVKVLLEIPGLENATLKDVTTFPLIMGAIGAGLAAFAIGKTAEGVSEGMQEGLEAFTEVGYADRIKKEVETLLLIPSLPGANLGNATDFIGVMGGIGLGLAAFAVGKGLEGGAEGVQTAVETFSEEGYADRIKGEVETLLSITELTDDGKATSFASSLSKISLGLVAFAGAEFVGALAGVGTSILNFFSGEDSAFEQIRIIAADADQLEKGANAVDKLQGALDKIGGLQFDGSKLKLKAFANDLAEAVPIIEFALMGSRGEDLSWWPFYGGVQLKGLANPEVGFDEAAKNINSLRGALGMDTSISTEAGSGGEGTRQNLVKTMVVEQMLVNDLLGAGGGGATVINNNQDNSVQSSSNTSLETGGSGGTVDLTFLPSNF